MNEVTFLPTMSILLGGNYTKVPPTKFLLETALCCELYSISYNISEDFPSISNRKCFYRAKGFQHQRMTNGAMNVEIGNPTYKMYEGEPDDDVGELIDADFTLDPDKVK